jgi:hypothetical protein
VCCSRNIGGLSSETKGAGKGLGISGDCSRAVT